MAISVREKTGNHYSWIATDLYRHNYGYLAFAQARGMALVAVSRDGHKLIPADDQPGYYNPDRVQLDLIPKPLLLLGTSYVSGLVHPHANCLRLLLEFTFAVKDETVLDDLLGTERE